MAFVLIAITILFALVGMLFLVFKYAGLKGAATEISEENAELLVAKLANSPEFSCGDSFDYGMAACIDADKVMALKKNIEKYQGFWEVSDIEVRKLKGDTECTFQNYPNCDVIRLNSGDISGSYTSNFVVLCYKDLFEGNVVDKCNIGKLMVAYKPGGDN